MVFSLKEGEELVKLARRRIEAYFKSEDVSDDKFKEKLGVFVTLNKDGELRGCIGFIEPVFSLSKGVIEAAKAAAFADPRFMPLQKDELGEIKVEVSVLSKPELMTGDYAKQIKIGRDGLIVEKDGFRGLLLPQVAPEWKWDAKEFLEHTCEKAGLDRGCWKEKSCKVYKFSAQIFKEEGNRVVEEKF